RPSRNRPRPMCGFIGIYGPDGLDVAPEIYEGLIAIQHRGQDAAGITTFTDTFHVAKGFGLVRDVFDARNMPRLLGNLGLGHVRYPTVGTGHAEDAQPFHVNFPVGVAMAHNGNVTNFDELKRRYFLSSGTRLNSSCDLEAILWVFARALSERLHPGARVGPEEVFAAVAEVYREVRGAYSVVAVLPDVGLVAFRDPYGIKPIVFGARRDELGTWYAVASESVVLDVIGYERLFDLQAGEAVFVGADREVRRRKLTDKPHRPCVFELVYFARPDSLLDDISVYKTRIRFGQALAAQWQAEGAPTPDAVIPIPDSSRDAGMAMATALGVPYREGLVKNRYIGRTFIMPSQESRRNSVRRKLNAIKLEFEGKDVLLVDDSIVRGNTALRIVRMARDAGARKVYLASTSPPLVSPCPYGIDMATKTEFIAAGKTNAEIAAALEVDHLLYLDRDAMNAAARAGNPEVEDFCNACFTGHYPTGDITREVLQAIEGERCNSQRVFAFTQES
ncbi:MAG TPA: amidophosphoribosyltransferase, partial [Planctomycetota bacterium]|nr:amidophosphoribosyltransferase [Planctomycetota bacterium]